MAHWDHRDEPGWQKFRFNQPFADASRVRA